MWSFSLMLRRAVIVERPEIIKVRVKRVVFIKICMKCDTVKVACP